ncbi:MAG: phosphoenolpyruvate carboxylase [Bacteroidetes bacterium]|nr:phosphoenolpyruvate carboxylase [Bacteroidota bacterium]
MTKQNLETLFTQEVHNKYLVFNTLFSRLPYDKMTNIGQLMPFLHDNAELGFENGKTPKEIIDGFFERYTSIKTEKEKIDLLFRFITYIERQVVLFDSVEDSAFEKLQAHNNLGSINAILALAKQEGKIEEVKEKLRNFKVRMVFTAHPTQFYPNSVLRIIQDLEECIKTNDINAIDSLLQQLGKTPFINEQQPTPVEEAQSIIFFLRHVYYDALGMLHDKIYGDLMDNDENFKPIIELGFWPGGDRDGNPFVTAEITKRVAQELRTNILKCYYNHFKDIRRRFTFKGIIPMLDKINAKIYTNMFGLNNDLTADELLSDMLAVREKMVTHHKSMFIDEMDRFIHRIKLFGLHFASLDIRQDSSIHEKVMEAVNQKFKISEKNYADWTEAEKIEFLTHADLNVNEEEFEDSLVKDTFKTIRAVAEIQAKNGEKACHRYIISNSTSACSVLEVEAMFRFCGISGKNLNVDIVPLFETIEGLDSARDSMDKLYRLPQYEQHLHHRHHFQTIMLGFSDGTKDGGYIKANWEIYKAKEKLTAISAQHGVNVIFFDGRGGPPARGGGKTHQFYASQGPTIANNEIQITIQGQTISSMYGSVPQAVFNFEQLLSAGIINDVFTDNKSLLDSNEKKLIEELADLGGEKYLELKNHPLFVPYLENKSPLKYYGKTNIGSRPSKRSSGAKLKLSDLRAIPFVGSWSQLKQNVPGFFGFGTALQKKIDQGKLDELRSLFENSLYFKTLMQNSMMALSKTYFPLTSYMKNDPVYGEFWNILYEESQRSIQNMLLVSGQKELMETDPISMLSVNYREHIVLPLLAIQQYALQKLEETEDETEKQVFEKMVTRSLFGNINASRNSA